MTGRLVDVLTEWHDPGLFWWWRPLAAMVMLGLVVGATINLEAAVAWIFGVPSGWMLGGWVVSGLHEDSLERLVRARFGRRVGP